MRGDYGISHFDLARLKNGFEGARGGGGYRDIKLNLVFQSSQATCAHAHTHTLLVFEA
jgi:hypothetical protein